MKRVSIKIALFILIAWVAALLLNIDIYRKTNIELNIFGPVVDAILLVFIILTGFIFVAMNWHKDTIKKVINASLLVVGICTIFAISYFYIVTFR